MIRALPLALVLLPATAPAAERTVALSSFTRVRVEGAYDVTIATGRSPGATLSGDRDALDAVEMRLDGTSLVVRRGANGWNSSAPSTRSAAPVAIALTTPDLASASVVGASRLKIARMKADRVDLSLAGTGTIAVDALEAARAQVTLVGAGTVSLAGKVASLRLLTSGAGSIDASGLAANEVTVGLDGTGETRANARDSADVTNTGLGRVTITGGARCRVRPATAGPVTCGAAAP